MKGSTFCAAAALLLLWTAPAFSQHMHHDKAKEKPAADTSRAAKTVYRCPMHPEVGSDKPGKCPKCGMKLEQNTPEPAKDTTNTRHTLAPDSTDGRRTAEHPCCCSEKGDV